MDTLSWELVALICSDLSQEVDTLIYLKVDALPSEVDAHSLEVDGVLPPTLISATTSIMR